MMDKGGGDMGGQAANNSSDFVRKLYKMLEDPTYESIVRWGEGGESFVVLENDKFTKHILPKHFKHSNFASFVRQLNKYDFHKVRQSNEDSVPSPYGPNAWEFKHPEFQANKKDALDNIRRKAPAPRKAAQGSEESPSVQVDLVNSQLLAVQQQLSTVETRCADLAANNALLCQQVFQLQKFIKNHDGVMHRVVGFLQSLDAERRNNRAAAAGFPPGSAAGSPLAYHPASPLTKASALLDELSAENLPNKELEQRAQGLRVQPDFSTPTTDQSGAAPLTAHSEASTANLAYPLSADLDSMVYPVGHTNGIDPINSDHINNIPYALPQDAMSIDPMTIMPPNGASKPINCAWGSTKPRVLLVEDDALCAKIGAKFLDTFDCECTKAENGLDAVNKINGAPNYFDLILMDIIMPHLDGVSATVCIRETRPTIPVIAMTSNIRADDIDVYFKHGMNDVLAKPFAKETMIKTLMKHLPYTQKGPFKKDAQQQSGVATPEPQSQAPLSLDMAQLSAPPTTIKEEPAGKSPVTATSWHSPVQIPGPSPIASVSGGYMQPMRDGMYNMTPTHTHPPTSFPPPGVAPLRATPHRRMMTDMSGPDAPDDHPEKRQRMYPGAIAR